MSRTALAAVSTHRLPQQFTPSREAGGGGVSLSHSSGQQALTQQWVPALCCHLVCSKEHLRTARHPSSVDQDTDTHGDGQFLPPQTRHRFVMYQALWLSSLTIHVTTCEQLQYMGCPMVVSSVFTIMPGTHSQL